MTPISPNKAGLVLGSVVGGWHLLWSSLVLFGWAQLVIDFIFWIHFIKPVYVIEPFNVGIAIVLFPCLVRTGSLNVLEVGLSLG
jgi:hypothetical protein